MVKKNSTEYLCQNCGHRALKWMGKCIECGEWNTFEEEVVAREKAKRGPGPDRAGPYPKSLDEISDESYQRLTTGISEFDRVIGGGIVCGSLILVGGAPGVGKSTLLTSIIGKLSDQLDDFILYVSGEESMEQVADRIRRLGIINSKILVLHETCWQNILDSINKYRPKIIILDSIQTTISNEVQSPAGTISQIREVTYELMNHVKANNITCFVVGHITKEGAIAGPKILEHMVDTVIYFEGDQLGHHRMLRAIKNRFGNTNEVGIFEMGEGGLKEVNNPSQLFLDERIDNAFGRSLSCIIEGTRPLFVEIQALVLETGIGYPKRTTQGVDNNRLSMLIAIIDKYFGIHIGQNDIYLNVVGGIQLRSRESDLSIIASIISSHHRRPICSSTIFIGEVGLNAEVRSVNQMEKRLNELSLLKYERVITSQKMAEKLKGKFSIELIGIKQVMEIEELLF